MNKITMFSNMVVFSSYGIQVIISFLMLTFIFMIFPRAKVSANRINEVLDEEVSIVVSKYHEKESKVIQPVKSLDLNKVEYTFDDLIALFT